MQKWENSYGWANFGQKSYFFHKHLHLGLTYIDDQNLNGPLGLKWPIQAAHAHMARSSLNCPVLGFCYQYATQIKALMKKNKIFGQNWLINSCFPILKGCPDLFGHIFRTL